MTCNNPKLFISAKEHKYVYANERKKNREDYTFEDIRFPLEGSSLLQEVKVIESILYPLVPKDIPSNIKVLIEAINYIRTYNSTCPSFLAFDFHAIAKNIGLSNVLTLFKLCSDDIVNDKLKLRRAREKVYHKVTGSSYFLDNFEKGIIKNRGNDPALFYSCPSSSVSMLPVERYTEKEIREEVDSFLYLRFNPFRYMCFFNFKPGERNLFRDFIGIQMRAESNSLLIKIQETHSQTREALQRYKRNNLSHLLNFNPIADEFNFVSSLIAKDISTSVINSQEAINDLEYWLETENKYFNIFKNRLLKYFEPVELQNVGGLEVVTNEYSALDSYFPSMVSTNNISVQKSFTGSHLIFTFFKEGNTNSKKEAIKRINEERKQDPFKIASSLQRSKTFKEFIERLSSFIRNNFRYEEERSPDDILEMRNESLESIQIIQQVVVDSDLNIVENNVIKDASIGDFAFNYFL